MTTEITHYYSLTGKLTKDGELVTDENEISKLISNWMSATHGYEREGFRFVDADGSATITEGLVSLNWSDYGLNR